MEIDTTFPTRLETVADVPEPLRRVLVESLPSGESVRLLVHSPAFPTGDEKSPATVLAVTNNDWFVASETEEGGATLEKSSFSDILFLELRSILLLGQLRISFAAGGASSSVTINFETVWDEFYFEAIELMLAGAHPPGEAVTAIDRNETAMFEDWPMKFRNEAKRYWPRGQRLLAALRWPTVCGEFQREIAPAGALLITGRELVLISDEKESSAETPSAQEREGKPTEPEISRTETPPEMTLDPALEKSEADPGKLPGDVYEFGEAITFVPRVRLAHFQVSKQEHFGVLILQVKSAHGKEKLEVIFPSDHEEAVSKAMEQVSLSRE
jgi:hypothetical protein